MDGNGQLRVLMIEDDPDTAELYRIKLRSDGCAVTVAQDGEAGHELAAGLQPDIIILDVRLPKLDGLQVLAKLHAERATRDIPVLMLSNESSPITIGVCRELGALDYLIKTETPPSALCRAVMTYASRGNGDVLAS